MIEMIHSGTWDGVFRVLRDPIFALIFAVFLAFLSSRPIRRLVRFACLLAAVVILIWLAANNTSSAHVEMTVVTSVTRVLLALVAVLFIVALIAIAALLIMYFKTAPASPARYGGKSAWRARPSLLEHNFPSVSTSALQESSLGDSADGDLTNRLVSEESNHLSDNFERMMHLLEDLFDTVDYDTNSVRACMEVVRIYFSGLSARSAEIRKIHQECNTSIDHIASALEGTSYASSLPLRDMSQKNWFPTSSEWAAAIDDSDLPYLAVRIICLKSDWRAVAMIMYKSYACSMILAQLN